MDDIAARQLAQTLTFKVEAVPQEGVSPTRSCGNMTPLNVKIRVRKKDDGKSSVPKGIIFVPKSGQAENLSERLRQASSDHTILSFNMLMETEHERKRKSRKNTFFGNCLGAQTDDDDGPYLPTTESKSESRFGMIKLKNTIPDEIGTSQALMRKNTNFFGVCKPGGCLDPPFGEDRYAYQPAPLKQNTRSENITKGVVIIPPIRIEPIEAVKIDTDERLRDRVVKVGPKEITEKEADDEPEIYKNEKGKEFSKTQKKSSADDQNKKKISSDDRNNMKIEKLRNSASSNRSESNEFSTLFFSPPKKASSKDSGSSRKNSKLEQRRNTPEVLKTPIPLSRKDDKQKLGPKIDEKTVSGKQISSAPVIILSDTETSDTADQNRSPEIFPNRSQDQRKIFIIPLGEEPADISKRAVSTLSFPIDDRNKSKEYDSTQISNEQELTPKKIFPKDTADITKQQINKPPAPLSDILSPDVIESQQDNIIESEKGSLVISPITEMIIPPVGKIIKHSQTDDLVKDKSESFDETRKHSSSQLTTNDTSEPSKIMKESTLKEPVKIEKLCGLKTIKAKLSDDNNKAMSPENEMEAQQTDGPRMSTRISNPTELLDIIKQPIRISKENSDKKQEQKTSQRPIMIPDHYSIDGEIPVTKKVDVNQYQLHEDKKFSDQMKMVDYTKEGDLLKDKFRPSISPDRTEISVKTKNENTQLQPDQPKKELLVVVPQNRDSSASYKKVSDNEIKMQPYQSLNGEFKKSPQLQERHKKSDQHMISEDIQKFKSLSIMQSEPHKPIIAQDSLNTDYLEVDNNQKHYPSKIQDIKITQAYDTNKQQFFEPKTHGLLDHSQVSTKGANGDDPHYINLVFQKYTYDNKTGIKTLDADANFEPDENIVTYKSNSHTQDKKIMIPIDKQNVMAIKIKKSSSTGDNDEEELLVPRSNIHKVSDSSKGEYETRTLKRGMFNEPQKDYTDENDPGFELPPIKRKSLIEGKHDSKNETGAKIYLPKRSSVPENRKASSSTRNSAESKMPSTTFKDNKPQMFDGTDFETGTKPFKRDSKHSDRKGTSNKRGSFVPDRVDLLNDRSGTGSKVTSPRQSIFNERKHVSTDGTHSVEPITSSKWGIVGEESKYSRDDRKSTEATMSSYERNSIKGVSILDMSTKRSTLLSDTGSRGYLQKQILRDSRTDSKGEIISFIPRDIDKNDEIHMISRQPSTISGTDPLGRSEIETNDDPSYFFDNSRYGGNVKYTSRTDTETDIPILFDGTVPAKRISSFVSRPDSKPSNSSFRQISLDGNARKPLDDKTDVNKRSFSYYGENRSGSTYGRNESGTRMRSSKGETYNEAKSDYTSGIVDDRNIGVIKYDSFIDTRKVDSFIEEKSGRSSGALYPFEDDEASYSKANKKINSTAHSRSLPVDHDNAYINKRKPHEKNDKKLKGKTYSRPVDANTEFQFTENGTRGKVQYSTEDDSRIAVIGREINRTLSFIYEHELIPLQHVIKGLKEDIDVLAEQQVLLREKLHGPRRVRPVRKCGCFNSYDFGSILE